MAEDNTKVIARGLFYTNHPELSQEDAQRLQQAFDNFYAALTPVLGLAVVESIGQAKMVKIDHNLSGMSIEWDSGSGDNRDQRQSVSILDPRFSRHKP